MKTVYKKKQMYLGTYPILLTIIYTNNESRVRKDYPHSPDQEDPDDLACYSQFYSDGEIIVVFNERLGKLTFGIIAHEACHIADNVFEHIQEKRTAECGHESYAYLVQFIVEQVCIFLVNTVGAKVYINEQY